MASSGSCSKSPVLAHEHNPNGSSAGARRPIRTREPGRAPAPVVHRNRSGRPYRTAPAPAAHCASACPAGTRDNARAGSGPMRMRALEEWSHIWSPATAPRPSWRGEHLLIDKFALCIQGEIIPRARELLDLHRRPEILLQEMLEGDGRARLQSQKSGEETAASGRALPAGLAALWCRCPPGPADTRSPDVLRAEAAATRYLRHAW